MFCASRECAEACAHALLRRTRPFSGLLAGMAPGSPRVLAPLRLAAHSLGTFQRPRVASRPPITFLCSCPRRVAGSKSCLKRKAVVPSSLSTPHHDRVVARGCNSSDFPPYHKCPAEWLQRNGHRILWSGPTNLARRRIGAAGSASDEYSCAWAGLLRGRRCGRPGRTDPGTTNPAPKPEPEEASLVRTPRKSNGKLGDCSEQGETLG